MAAVLGVSAGAARDREGAGRPGASRRACARRARPPRRRALARAALEDTLAAVRRGRRGGRRVLVLDGRPGAWLPAGWDGRRRSAATASRSGSRPRSRTPAGRRSWSGWTRRRSRRRALAAGLRRARAAPTPCSARPSDGGYWSIGLRAPDPAVFAGHPDERAAHRRGAARAARGARPAHRRPAAAARRRRHRRGARRGRRRAGEPLRRRAARARAGRRSDRRDDRPPRRRGSSAAELLYGRLLASAAAGGEPAEARFRIADGRAQKLPLDRWLAPVDAADRAVLAHADGAGARHRLRARPPPRGARRRRPRRARASTSRPSRCGSRAPAAPRRSCAPCSPTSRAPGTWRTALLLDGNIGIGGAPGGAARARPRARRAGRRGAGRDRRRPARRRAASACGSRRPARSARGSAGRRSARTAIAPLARAAGLVRAAAVLERRRALVRAAGAAAVNPPPGPFRPAFWRSPLRGPWLTAVLGSLLLVLVDGGRADRLPLPRSPTSPTSGATRSSTPTSRSRRSSTGRPGRRGSTRSPRACTSTAGWSPSRSCSRSSGR